MSEKDETAVKVIETKKIPIDKIDIGNTQARQSQVTKSLEIFAEQIRKIGLIQPIVVYEQDDRYRLVVGQRRFYAHKDILRWDEILAMVIEKPQDGMMETTISWLENEARQRMSNKDKMRHVANMNAQKITQKEIARILGITQKEVKACIGLPRVPDIVRQAVEKGEITPEIAIRATDAKQFDKYDTPEDTGNDVLNLAKQMLADKLSNKEITNVVDYGDEHPGASNETLLSEGVKNTTESITVDLQASDMKRLERYARNNNHSSKAKAAVELIINSLDQSGD